MEITFKPYPHYQETGHEWLGLVPSHWKVLPNRAIFQEMKDQNHPDEPLLSVTISRGVLPQEDLLANSSKKDSSNLDKSKYKLVQPGDIAYNKMRAWQGALGVSRHQGIVSPAYIVVRPRQEQDSRFFHYLLRTPSFIKEAERWSYGITSDMWSLRYEDFKLIYCILPPLVEQRQIAHYLDRQNQRVRRLIHTKQRLIALLNEQKQAIIQRAVTRGLDPDVPLKPSGVDWLGEVPAHWDIRRLKQVATITRGRFSHRPRNDPRLYEGPYPFIQTGDVARAQKYVTSYNQTLNEKGLNVSKLFPKGTLVITIAANIGDSAILNFDACFPDSIVGFLPRRLIDKDFLYYVLRFLKAEFLREAPVNTQGNLNTQRIGAMAACLPPLCEQKQIVASIENATNSLNAAEVGARREIDLIREYRTRLIVDVVTGKLDVRGVALTGVEEEAEAAESEALTDIEEAAYADE